MPLLGSVPSQMLCLHSPTRMRMGAYLWSVWGFGSSKPTQRHSLCSEGTLPLWYLSVAAEHYRRVFGAQVSDHVVCLHFFSLLFLFEQSLHSIQCTTSAESMHITHFHEIIAKKTIPSGVYVIMLCSYLLRSSIMCNILEDDGKSCNYN